MKTKPKKKQSLEIYHNEKHGCFRSNEYWYDNVNFLQKKSQQEEDFVAEKLSQKIIRNSLMEDHYY